MLIPGMAPRAILITLPQALTPVQTALRLCLAKHKAWVKQADVLLTKHQLAKSLWLHTHTQADVMLTNHRKLSPCGHKHRTKVLKEKQESEIGQKQ